VQVVKTPKRFLRPQLAVAKAAGMAHGRLGKVFSNGPHLRADVQKHALDRYLVVSTVFDANSLAGNDHRLAANLRWIEDLGKDRGFAEQRVGASSSLICCNFCFCQWLAKALGLLSGDVGRELAPGWSRLASVGHSL